MKPDKLEVGKRIKRIRLERGYTLESFGKKVQPFAAKNTVRSWEIGKSLPNKRRLKQIADIANITVEELLYGTLDTTQLELLEKLKSMDRFKVDELFKLYFEWQIEQQKK